VFGTNNTRTPVEHLRVPVIGIDVTLAFTNAARSGLPRRGAAGGALRDRAADRPGRDRLGIDRVELRGAT